MTVTRTIEDENFAKHFFNKKREGEKEKRSAEAGSREGERLFAKGVLHSPWGDLCIHTPAPDKRNRAALEPSELGAEEAREERSMIDGVLVGL